MLNAKPENISKESNIIAQSGRESAVTVSTNMAGRGTDIILGGNPGSMARLKLRNMLFSTSSTSETDFLCEPCVQIPDEVNKNVEEFKKLCSERNLSSYDIDNLFRIACERGP